MTFRYGVLSGDADLTGEKFELTSTDDLDEKDIKRLIFALGAEMLKT